MPLSVLVPMILIALPLVIGLVWWMNRGNVLVPLTEETVSSRFAEDFPNEGVSKIWISNPGNEALVSLKGRGRFGLVHQIGNNHLTRLLKLEDIRDMRGDGDKLDIRFNDFTLRSISFVPSGDSEYAEVIGYLKNLGD